MRFILLFIALFSVSLMTLAQTTYQPNDFAEPGTSSFVSNLKALQLVGKDFSPTGENYQWDYSNLSLDSQQKKGYLSPDFNGFRESFIALCVAGGGGLLDCIAKWEDFAYMSETFSDTIEVGGVSMTALTSVYDKSDEAFYQTMIGGMVGMETGYVPVVLELEDYDTLLQFPVEYGQEFASHGRYVIDMNSLGSDFVYIWDRKTESVVEGYGSLTLPSKSYDDVLKVRKSIDIADTIIVNGTILSNPFDNRVVYQWFSPKEKLPLLEVHGYQLLGGVEIYTEGFYIDTIYCSEEPLAFFYSRPFFPFIDPETNTSEVGFTNLSYNANEWEWDFGDPESGDANYSTEMNPFHTYTKEGTYSVTLTAINTVCTPPETDEITFPVIVTDSSQVGLPSYEKMAIQVSPNPFSDVIHVKNDHAKEVTLRVTDIYGKNVLKTCVAPHTEKNISTSHLQHGIYLIHYVVDEKREGSMKLLKTTTR